MAARTSLRAAAGTGHSGESLRKTPDEFHRLPSGASAAIWRQMPSRLGEPFSLSWCVPPSAQPARPERLSAAGAAVAGVTAAGIWLEVDHQPRCGGWGLLFSAYRCCCFGHGRASLKDGS
jgi:hypothetical protein